MRLKSFLIRVPAPALLAASWILSSRSSVPMPGFNAADKLVHLVCFAALAFSWALWFPREAWSERPVKTALAVAAMTSAYGAVDELHQSFVPGRFASVLDWGADTLGGLLGGLAALAAFRLLRRKEIPGRDDAAS